ncbi:MAG TPA: SIMPL domain-containing protein [Sphingomonas sp.]|nr:SIMPL domain-containing protein [Sphingomonas sp.]
MRAATAVTMLALAATLASCGRHHNGSNRLGAEETLLQVSATATGEAKPDEARFSAGVSTIGATAAAASQLNNQRMSAVVTALKQFGVKDSDVQTQTLTISRIGYGANRGKFEANNVVSVRMHQVDKAGAAIAATTGAGANVLSGPDLRTADPEAATRALAGSAFKAARARADAYAAAAGLKVVRVLTIRDGGGSSSPMQLAENMDSAGLMQARAPAPVMAGTNTSTVTVSVDFALAPN